MYPPLLLSSSSTTRILKYFKLLLLEQTSKKLSNPFQNSWQIIQWEIMNAVQNMRNVLLESILSSQVTLSRQKWSIVFSRSFHCSQLAFSIPTRLVFPSSTVVSQSGTVPFNTWWPASRRLTLSTRKPVLHAWVCLFQRIHMYVYTVSWIRWMCTCERDRVTRRQASRSAAVGRLAF